MVDSWINYGISRKIWSRPQLMTCVPIDVGLLVRWMIWLSLFIMAQKFRLSWNIRICPDFFGEVTGHLRMTCMVLRCKQKPWKKSWQKTWKNEKNIYIPYWWGFQPEMFLRTAMPQLKREAQNCLGVVRVTAFRDCVNKQTPRTKWNFPVGTNHLQGGAP